MSGQGGNISPNFTKLITLNNDLIVSATEFGQWANLSASVITSQQTMIEGLIRTATEVIEDYTWLNLRQKTYEAYYDLPENIFFGFLFGSYKLELQRSPILSLSNISKIEYLNSSSQWTEFDRGTMTIDGLYENTTEILNNRYWASIYFRENVPFYDRCVAYKIRITFSVGYDIAETEEHLKLPQRIKTAILDIVNFHYTYRGDCPATCTANGYPIPCETKSLLDALSIKNSTLGFYYNPVNGGCYGCN